MSPTKAIVLAGGEGMRLRPLTEHRPKPMLPAADRPILEYVFDSLIEAGVSQFHVVVGYKRERVQSHFGPTYRGHPITYHFQENQLGSGHALLQARDAIEETTVVVNGDQIVDHELITAVVDAHDDTIATLGVVEDDQSEQYGWVSTDDGHVLDIVEQREHPPGYRLNAGVYVFDPSIVEMIETVDPIRQEHSLIRALQQCMEEDQAVRAVEADGVWTDATYPWNILSIARDVFSYDLVDGGTATRKIAASAHIHETATLTAPVVIGADTEVGPGAILGPYTAVGSNVTVGGGAVIENSVLDADTRVGANATLLDCVTGQGAYLGPGCVVPGGPADVSVGNHIFEDKRLGAVLADRSTVGGSATIGPGSLIGSGATLAPGSVVRDAVTADAEVRN